MEVIERQRQLDKFQAELEADAKRGKTLLDRYDPCKELSETPDVIVRCVLAPLWIINYVFPFRFFTSWYRMFIVVDVILYLTDTWRDSMVAGSIWILSLFVPLASSFILVYAKEEREKLAHLYDGYTLTFHHVLMHVIPSEILFLVVPLPAPPFLLSTALVLCYYLIYGLLLYLIWGETYLSNYGIHDHNHLPVVCLWSLCLVFCCFMMEFLFWNSNGLIRPPTEIPHKFCSARVDLPIQIWQWMEPNFHVENPICD